MVLVTLERVECDICGQPGERYTIHYPEGIVTLDRCDRHASKLLALREEKGAEWTAAPAPKGRFKVSSPEDIKAQKQ